MARKHLEGIEEKNMGKIFERSLAYLFLSLCMASLPTAMMATQLSPVATVTSGTIRGEVTSDGGAVFKGIPYAAAPVGPLRWTPPATVERWQGVRDGTTFGHSCAQPDQKWNSADAANGSEDCLYLNVWTPKFTPSAHLPVMVWIHGGGFLGGSGDSPVNAGGRMAAHGVIVVSFNYRLHVFGFLAHPKLTDGTSGKALSNFGMLDQIAALQWVKTNIARFGGDPANVTIFGQSAGGAIVLDLLASPLAAGLTQHAIIESGVAVPMIPTPSLVTAEDTGVRFAGSLTIAQLRALPTEEIMRRYLAFSPQVMTSFRDQFLPMIDGTVLTDDPDSVFAKGDQLKIPLIIGNNAREGPGRLTDAELVGALQKTYGSNAPAAMHEYGLDAATPPAPDPVLGDAQASWLTDSTLRCGAVMVAKWHSAAGAPVYEYQFEQSLPSHSASGAAHGYELPYVFGNLLPSGNLGSTFTSADHTLADTMMIYWTNFAKTGNPNWADVPVWPKFDIDKRAFVRLSTQFNGNVKADNGLRKNACELYEHSLASH